MDEKPKIHVEKESGLIPRLLKSFFTLVYTIIVDLIGLVFWAVNLVIFFIIVSFRVVLSVLHLVIVYIPRIIGRFVPSQVGVKLDQTLIYAGVEMTADSVIGMTFVYSIMISLITYLVSGFFELSQFYRLVTAGIAFFAVWVFPRVMLDALIYKRTQNIELVLPDILDIIAQNIRVGMTTDRALWSAARPEFGPLATELQMAARATLSGTPLPDALISITNRIRSERLERAIRLIIQGITSGGELPAILQTIAIDMRSEQNLLKQMAAETNAHVLFIMFAIMGGAPLLFAVSLQFIVVFSTLMSKIDISKLASLPHGAMGIMFKPFLVSPDFYFKYVIAALLVLCFFGSFLIGLLRTGRPIAGLQYIPIITFVSLAAFLVLNYVLTYFFAGAFTVQ